MTRSQVVVLDVGMYLRAVVLKDVSCENILPELGIDPVSLGFPAIALQRLRTHSRHHNAVEIDTHLFTDQYMRYIKVKKS